MNTLKFGGSICVVHVCILKHPVRVHGVLGFYRVGKYLSDEHMGVRELVDWWDRKGRVMEDGR